jgi:hypothetical protein
MFHSALRVGLGTPAFHSSLGDVLAMSSLPQAAFGGFDTYRFVDAISTASRAATAGFDTHRFADIISTASRAATTGLDRLFAVLSGLLSVRPCRRAWGW